MLFFQEPLKSFQSMAQQLHLYRLSWAACCHICVSKSPKQGPEVLSERRFGPTLHVELGFETTALRGNQPLG